MAEADAEALLFERLSEALSPDHTLIRQVAEGGMGRVYLAHDVSLDRPVAVKLLKPELASAELAARFLREAHLLAKLRHPNVVGVHQVRERNGLFYYIMDWLEGETLQARLLRGRLTTPETIDLGADLLAALAVVHQQQWIHRDVKPSNIFLTDGRAVLTDFGIARALDNLDTPLTNTQQMMGTLGYMPPEQREGRPATEASDIYAAGIVLYEAHTGQRWWLRDRASPLDWDGVPRHLSRVLRKALSHEPHLRWESAGAMRQGLVRARHARLVSPVVWGVAGLLIVATIAVLGMLVFGRRDSRNVRLQELNFSGTGRDGWLRDSVGYGIVAVLKDYPDLVVSGPFGRTDGRLRSAAIVLSGDIEGDDARVQVTMHSSSGGCIAATASGASTSWRTLVDSLTTDLLRDLYRCESRIDPMIPRDALPESVAGMEAWRKAEPLFIQARWGQADSAFRAAEAIDPSCLICAFRINDIDRWLDRPHDPARLAHLQANIGAFPEHYRLLIRAASTPWPARLAIMDSATRARDFFLAWFHMGDELFHRGPLYGHSRSEAILAFDRARKLRPDFAPAWEHLAWVQIAEGNSGEAQQALDTLELIEPHDQTSMGLRLLLRAAFAFRFKPPGSGDAIIRSALENPYVRSYQYLPMAPRLMLSFDAPGAALVAGQIFAAETDLALVRSGLIAEINGNIARGSPDSALHLARLLSERVPGAEGEVYAAELAGTMVLVDGDSNEMYNDEAQRTRELLRRYTLPDAVTEGARLRTAWKFVLLARRTGGGNETTEALQLLTDAAEPEARYYRELLQADAEAANGNYTRALQLTDWSGDDLVRLPDPFFSTVVHFFRASWFAAAGNPAAAMRTLLFHEASDFSTYPIAQVQPPESDQAFGTLARWRQARLLDVPGNPGPDVCRSYRAVFRLWQNGSSSHRSRANLAAERLRALPCDP